MEASLNHCYYDGEPCDCGAFDVAGDCPRDPYTHEDDEFVTEDMIDEAYAELNGARYAQEIFR
jgi:hypothetical protein